MNDQNTVSWGAAPISRISRAAPDAVALIAPAASARCVSPVRLNSNYSPEPYIPEPIIETRRVKARPGLRRKEKRNLTRHYRYHAQWKRSGHPLPNRFLTVRFDRQQLREWKLAGKTVAAYAGETLWPLLRGFMAESSHPWLAQWVIEAKSCPHIHILFYMPEGVELEIQLCHKLASHYGMTIPAGSHPIEYLDRTETSAPVCFNQITPARSYKRTLRYGLEGALDYLAKRICKNATRQKRRTTYDLGKIVGRSNDILCR